MMELVLHIDMLLVAYRYAEQEPGPAAAGLPATCLTVPIVGPESFAWFIPAWGGMNGHRVNLSKIRR